MVINRSINQGSGIGPCFFVAMIAELVPKYDSIIYCCNIFNIFIDKSILIPGIYYSHACDEIDPLKQWSSIK
jgi:hypothetical protein